MTKAEIKKKVMEYLSNKYPDADIKDSTKLGTVEEIKKAIDDGKTDAMVKALLKAVGHTGAATSVSVDADSTVSTLAVSIADEMNKDMVEEALRRKKERDLAEAADDDKKDDDDDDDKKKKDDDKEDEDEDDDEDLEEAKKKKKKKDDEEELMEASDDDDEDDDDDKKKKKDDDKDDDEDEDKDEDLEEAYHKQKKEKKEKMKKEMMEDINKLFADEDTLTEEFKEKAALIFETALNRRIDEEVETLREELEEQYNANLKEAVEAHAEQLHEELDNLTGKIDEYITYVAEEWLKENELSVEKGIRTEITENFIQGLKNLFVENYVDVPEGKEDLLESLEEKTGELEAQINTHLKRNMRLKKALQEEKKRNIIFEAAQDLSMADREQLTELSESVDFEDEDEFTKKVNIIKEHYFSHDSKSVITETKDMSEDEKFESSTLTEDHHAEKTVSAIDVYKKAISHYQF